MSRKRLQGKVVSDKMAKTVVVDVERTYRHPRYEKVLRANKRYKAYDELGAKEGSLVEIAECSPRSADKTFEVVKILEEA
ncbi:MAG: 30S ribosomal protein S17 [Patescibacteria group bacterium]